LPPYRDFLVCGVSSQLRQHVTNFDEITSPSDSDFVSNGLISEAVIRLGFLAVLPQNRVAGAIGEISSKRHRRLLKTLSDYLVGKKSQKRKTSE
jgi:mRNA interferase MazF